MLNAPGEKVLDTSKQSLMKLASATRRHSRSASSNRMLPCPGTLHGRHLPWGTASAYLTTHAAVLSLVTSVSTYGDKLAAVWRAYLMKWWAEASTRKASHNFAGSDPNWRRIRANERQ